jgi:hypothetical protein
LIFRFLFYIYCLYRIELEHLIMYELIEYILESRNHITFIVFSIWTFLLCSVIINITFEFQLVK